MAYSKRPHKRAKKAAAAGGDMYDHLQTGNCFGCLVNPPQHTDDDVAAAWAESRDTVVGEWIREKPGTRPWGWWAFDAPEPKRRERTDGAAPLR